MVGSTTSAGAGGMDVATLEIDPATGNTLSTTLWGGAQDDVAYAAATDGADLYVIGASKSYATGAGNQVGQNDVVLLRYELGAGAPNLSITSVHTGSFTQGQSGATYTVTVSNAAAASPSSGAATVTETVPSGLTLASMAGTGWTCPSSGTTCTRSDVLAAGSSYPAITVTVNVASNAASPQVNQASVSGGGSATASASDSTTIVAVPVLSVASAHTGSFTQGQSGATYTVTVSNGASAGPTSGTVTVTETVPSGLTLVSMAGTGWTCPSSGTTCTRSDSLAAGSSYPAITVTVSVAANASSPQGNQVSVSGGGSATASATDSTVIHVVPVLSIASTHTGNFTNGQNGATYTVTVGGTVAATTATLVTMTETVPSGLTLVSMAGTGWTCPSSATTCTRSDVLAAGSSYPAITVTVNVASNAASPQVNQVSVAGGGAIGSASATDSTVVSVASASSIAVGAASAAPGAAFSVPITLTLGSGVSVDALTFGLQITPVGSAPALAGSLGFTPDNSITDTPFKSTNGTTNLISVVWSSLSTPISATHAVGVITGTIPSGATTGQTYTVAITGASATYLSNLVTVGAGASATLTVAITYKVGDVYPYTSDVAPNFGDSALDIRDLIQELFAVNSIPGYRPAACSDRFDAMDLYPADAGTTRGGDGSLDIRDLILELFRVNNLDLARPVRASRGGVCSSSGTAGTTELDTARRGGTTPANRGSAAGALIIGPVERQADGSERAPVYLSATEDLTRIAVTFGLGDQQSQLRFTAAPGFEPSLVQDGQLGVVAAAWLDGITVPAGGRLLLGYVGGPAGALSNVQFYGVSASGLDDSREVRLEAQTTTGLGR